MFAVFSGTLAACWVSFPRASWAFLGSNSRISSHQGNFDPSVCSHSNKNYPSVCSHSNKYDPSVCSRVSGKVIIFLRFLSVSHTFQFSTGSCYFLMDCETQHVSNPGGIDRKKNFQTSQNSL